MTSEILTVLVILGVAIVLMTTERLRADLVALLMPLALALAGAITPEQAFSGFSRSAVITILGLFILTHGLYRTGITARLGGALVRLAGERETLLVLLTVALAAGLSLFMNNIAVVALLMPAVMDAGRRTGTAPSKLLMPLAYGATLGGSATLLTTSNIVVSAVLQEQGLRPFGLLDFAPVGLPLTAIGILYLLALGHRLLPETSPLTPFERRASAPKTLADAYALGERLTEVNVAPGSALAGKTLAESQIGERLGLSVLGIRRSGQSLLLAPLPDQRLHAGDTLLVAGRAERVDQLTGFGCQVQAPAACVDQLSNDRVVLIEVLLAPRSAAAGRTLKELRFREKYGLSVVALWRGGRPYRTDVGDMRLQFGDTLLVYGARSRVAILQADPDFLVLAEPEMPFRARKGWLALGIMAAALVAAALNWLPIAEAALLGALGMVITGCLTMDEAYRAIEWRAIFLVAGMLPAAIALSQSGATEWLGGLVVSTLGTWGPWAVMAGLFLLTTLLTQVLSGQVVAVVLAPLAVAAAQGIGADPRALAMATALGCSVAFLTPTSHPVNVFVMGAGGYRFRDFLRVGLPLTVLEAVVVVVLLPLFWPLR